MLYFFLTIHIQDSRERNCFCFCKCIPNGMTRLVGAGVRTYFFIDHGLCFFFFFHLPNCSGTRIELKFCETPFVVYDLKIGNQQHVILLKCSFFSYYPLAVLRKQAAKLLKRTTTYQFLSFSLYILLESQVGIL